MAPPQPHSRQTEVVALNDGLAELTNEVRELKEHVRLLTRAIDEFRDDFVWAVRNASPEHLVPSPPRIDSLSADPTGDGFQINGVPKSVVDTLRDEVTRQSRGEPPPSQPQAPKTPSIAVPATPVVVTAQIPRPSKPRRGAKQRAAPLYMRIPQQPLLTDLVRLLGYRSMKNEQFIEGCKPLGEKYGHERLSAAVAELVSETFHQSGVVQLTPAAREASRTLLGSPPAAAVEKPPVEEVIKRFRAHAAEIGWSLQPIETRMRARLVKEGRLVPDFLEANDEIPQLIVLREGLSDKEREDMCVWRELFGMEYESARVWWHTDDGTWHVEVVAAPDDDE